MRDKYESLSLMSQHLSTKNPNSLTRIRIFIGERLAWWGLRLAFPEAFEAAAKPPIVLCQWPVSAKVAGSFESNVRETYSWPTLSPTRVLSSRRTQIREGRRSCVKQ